MAVAAAFSGTSFSALAAPCTFAPLSTYLSGGVNATCTVLDKTISGMTASGTVALVSPQEIVAMPGLFFLNLGSAVTITFTITAPSSDPMTGAFLGVVAVGTPSTVSEMLSNGASLSASNVDMTDSTTFAAATSLTVTDVSSSSGMVAGIANRFSETPIITAAPEPSSLALLGVGLSAFWLARRRKRS